MQIIKEPEKILRKKLKSVDPVKSPKDANGASKIPPGIKTLISDMRKKMVESHGVGLAANQIGRDLALFVIDKKLADESSVPDAYINPEITEFSKDTDEMEEGCLSIPDYWHQIKRAKKIKIKALDENGKKIKIKARGFLARVLQHEYDHLQGILIKDRV